MIIIFLIFFLICYLISFIIVKRFIKKNKWQWFFIIGWIVALLGFIINVFLHHDFGMDGFANISDLKIALVFSIYETMLEPLHHILFLVAVIWFIVDWYKKKKIFKQI